MSMWSVPEEIQVDIFIRLPETSILACRCVCKHWSSLLCNPKFIENHINLTLQSKNKNNTNCRLIFGQSQYDKGKNLMINSVDYQSVSSSASDLSEVKVVPMHYPFENKITKAIRTLESCNGLICLGISSGGIGIEAKNCICIWNPSTGEYKTIKLPLSDFLPESQYSVKYGFGGSDSNIDDYKLVKISCCVNGCLEKIQVYALGSKCWRTIQSTDGYMFPRQLHKMLPGVLSNGALHWSGATITTQEIPYKAIVCFDINSERLMDVPFPEETMLLPLQNWKMYRQVGVFGDCLSVMFSVIGVRTDTWVMQDYGVTDSWTNVFTTTQLTMTKDPFFMPTWSFQNGDVLVYSRRKLSLCDPNSGETRKVLLDGINMSNYPESYMESLVSLKLGT